MAGCTKARGWRRSENALRCRPGEGPSEGRKEQGGERERERGGGKGRSRWSEKPIKRLHPIRREEEEAAVAVSPIPVATDTPLTLLTQYSRAAERAAAECPRGRAVPRRGGGGGSTSAEPRRTAHLMFPFDQNFIHKTNKTYRST